MEQSRQVRPAVGIGGHRGIAFEAGTQLRDAIEPVLSGFLIQQAPELPVANQAQQKSAADLCNNCDCGGRFYRRCSGHANSALASRCTEAIARLRMRPRI